jgi:hypothetical protein
MSKIRVSEHCICGSSFTGTHVHTPKAEIDQVVALWRASHTGPGHAPCDAETARRAARRIEEG